MLIACCIVWGDATVDIFQMSNPDHGQGALNNDNKTADGRRFYNYCYTILSEGIEIGKLSLLDP